MVSSDFIISLTKAFTVPMLMLSWEAITPWGSPDKYALSISLFNQFLLINVISDVYINATFELKNLAVGICGRNLSLKHVVNFAESFLNIKRTKNKNYLKDF